jgi:hypothetical protein
MTEKFLNPHFLVPEWHVNIFQWQEIIAVPLLTLQIQGINLLFFGHKAWTSFLEFDLPFCYYANSKKTMKQ